MLISIFNRQNITAAVKYAITSARTVTNYGYYFKLSILYKLFFQPIILYNNNENYFTTW